MREWIVRKVWKEVNSVRKKKEEVCGGIRNSEGVVVRGADKEVEVWSSYFERLLNEAERGRAVVEVNWDEELRGLLREEGELGRITELEKGGGP